MPQPFTDINQLVIGTKVICLYGNTRYLMKGVIVEIKPHDPRIGVRFGNDSYVEHWYYPSSFAPIDQQEIERMADLKRRQEHAMKFL